MFKTWGKCCESFAKHTPMIVCSGVVVGGCIGSFVSHRSSVGNRASHSDGIMVGMYAGAYVGFFICASPVILPPTLFCVGTYSIINVCFSPKKYD